MLADKTPKLQLRGMPASFININVGKLVYIGDKIEYEKSESK